MEVENGVLEDVWLVSKWSNYFPLPCGRKGIGLQGVGKGSFFARCFCDFCLSDLFFFQSQMVGSRSHLESMDIWEVRPKNIFFG